MGATIGARAQISKGAKLRDFDLLSLGDDVALDEATVRGFALEVRHDARHMWMASLPHSKE